MTTVKVDLQERTMLETALANGLFVNQLFFRPTEYIEKTDIHVTRCFNCQKFGHLANWVKNVVNARKIIIPIAVTNRNKTTDVSTVWNNTLQHRKNALSTRRLWRSCIRADRYPYQNNYKTKLTDLSLRTNGPHNASKHGRVKQS